MNLPLILIIIGIFTLSLITLMTIRWILKKKFKVTLFGDSVFASLREVFYGLHFPLKDSKEAYEKLKEDMKTSDLNKDVGEEKLKNMRIKFEKEVSKKEINKDNEKKVKQKKSKIDPITNTKEPDSEKDIEQTQKNQQSTQGKGQTTGQPGGINVKLRSFEDIMANIDDENIKKILEVFRTKNLDFITKLITDRIFNSKKEIMDFLKSEIINILNDQYNNLKYKLSQLKKKGSDIDPIRIKLMSVPFKINLFKASFLKSDFDKVIKIIDETDLLVQKFDIKKQ